MTSNLTSFAILQKALASVPKNLCRTCSALYCAATGDNEANAVMRVICQYCFQEIASFAVYRTATPGNERPHYFAPMSSTNSGFCPYGRRIIVSIRAHRTGDLGYEGCLAEFRRERRIDDAFNP